MKILPLLIPGKITNLFKESFRARFQINLSSFLGNFWQKKQKGNGRFYLTGIIFASFITLFSNEIFAQTTSEFSENNLPTPATTSPKTDNKAPDATDTSGTNIAPEDVGKDKNSSPDTNAAPSQNQANKDFSSGIKAVLLGEKTESLMFDEKESASISNAINARKNKENLSSEGLIDDTTTTQQTVEEIIESERSYIHLASLLYKNKNEWAVWVNDKKITSDNNKDKELVIETISRNSVKILWKLGISKWQILSGHVGDQDLPETNKNGEVEIRFSLKPNQTFFLKTKTTSEGRRVIEEAKTRQQEQRENQDATTSAGEPNTTNQPTQQPVSTTEQTTKK